MGDLIDPFGGQEDLRRRTIRAVGDADERFREDPYGCCGRCASPPSWGFEIEPATRDAIRRGPPPGADQPGAHRRRADLAPWSLPARPWACAWRPTWA